ncbi:MAG TPA: GNAT family N-acetyltransferase [Pilimelia sp.]|nr:GNAT family N-acetyltransferase [Pilimelia sp.]
MDVQIRPGFRADLRLLVDALGQPEFFADLLRDPTGSTSLLLVAWSDGVPIGDVVVQFAGADHPRIRDRQPDAPMIYHLEVAPAHQRRGIGSALVAAAEQEIRSRGHWLALLLVEVDNTDAARLYRRLGYVDWGNGTVEHAWQAADPRGGNQTVRQTCNVLIKSVDEGAPGLDAWDPWHPREAAARLAGLDVPWYVAAGWALDLWHGRQTREHGDLEIAVPRARLDRVRRHLTQAGFELYMSSGRLARLGPDDELPPQRHQVWVCEPEVPAWRLDVFCEPTDGVTWFFRRDQRIQAPYTEMVATTADGIPYLRPEAVLLFKARHAREKDEADLARALPRLTGAARDWLVAALDLVHPGHAWIARIHAGSGGRDAP